LELGERLAGGQVVWRSTGDEVEVLGRLIRIIGRADQVANVAGTKVSLAEVAAQAEAVSGVRRAMAVARSNPVTGQVVALRFALEPGADEASVRERLEATLRERLPKPAWPRDWTRDEVGLGHNAKRALE
jgi:acyl-coenzyme A synthetase/AMP-(fatty) acid ligase